MSYSLTCFALAAGDETLQLLQQLSASTRCEVDDWSLMLASDKPQPSPEFPGTRKCVELHRCFLAYFAAFILLSLANSFITSFSILLICFHAVKPLKRLPVGCATDG